MGTLRRIGDIMGGVIDVAFAPASEGLTGGLNATRVDVKASEGMAVAVAMKIGQAQYSPSDYRTQIKRYATNVVVYRATRMVAEAVASIEPYVVIGEKEDDKSKHPVSALLKRPNPGEGRKAFIESVASFWTLHGNSFIEAVDGMGGTPWQLFSLRPDYMQIIPGQNGWPQTYRYEVSGRRKDYRADIEQGLSQILHIKQFNPTDDIWGMSGLKVASRDLDIIERNQDLAKSIMDNGAMPSGAMVYKGNPEGNNKLSDDQFERLKAQMDKRHTGAKNAGRPMLLEGGLEWQQFGMSMVDLQQMEQVASAMRNAALALGVPPLVLGIPGDNTYANFAEAIRALYRMTALPLAERIYDDLGNWLGARFRTPGLEIKVDPDSIWALAEEVSSKWTRIETATDLSLDEKREAKGYGKYTGKGTNIGDKIYADSFRQPLDATVRTAEAGAVNAEIGAESAQVALEYQLENPAYDPSKDADGDMQSNDGTGQSSDKAKPKADAKKPAKE